MPNNTLQNIVCELKNTAEQLGAFDDILFSEEFYRFKQYQTSLNNELVLADDQDRLLRIGIVGSVKAGKSTFLNALLFNGQNILPKAATPMTASLTRLQYAENEYVRFVFYSQKDWNEITEIAEKATLEIKQLVEIQKAKIEQIKHPPYPSMPPQKEMENQAKRSLPPEQSACLELVENARESVLNLAELLGKTEEICLNKTEELGHCLRDYVGSDGKYTAIVRHVELGLNHPLLHDIEIIDTPGLNDPVVSRSTETYKSLIQCDAVFILSRASQFLSEHDISFIRNTLREDAIHHQIVIASQFDGSIANEKGNLTTFKDAFRRSRAVVSQAYKKQLGEGGPICVSSALEGCAYKQEHGMALNDEEKLILKNLNYFEGAPKSSEDLRRIGNIEAVRKELQSSKENKETILQNRKLELANSTKETALTSLRALEAHLRASQKDIEQINNDILHQRRKGITNALNSVENYTKELFLKAKADVQFSLKKLSQRLISNIGSYSDIIVHEEKHIERKLYDTTGFIFKTNHYHDVEITTCSVDLSEILSQLREFASKAQNDVIDTYAHLISVDSISEEIKKKMLPFIRDVEQDYDENMILIPLRSSLYDLNVKPFIFNNEKYNEHLVEAFPASTAKGEEIYRLKTEAELTFQRLGKDIAQLIQADDDRICKLLMEKSEGFIAAMRSNLYAQMDKLEQQLKEREANIERYACAIKIANTQIAKLLTIEE